VIDSRLKNCIVREQEKFALRTDIGIFWALSWSKFSENLSLGQILLEFGKNFLSLVDFLSLTGLEFSEKC